MVKKSLHVFEAFLRGIRLFGIFAFKRCLTGSSWELSHIHKYLVTWRYFQPFAQEQFKSFGWEVLLGIAHVDVSWILPSLVDRSKAFSNLKVTTISGILLKTYFETTKHINESSSNPLNLHVPNKKNEGNISLGKQKIGFSLWMEVYSFSPSSFFHLWISTMYSTTSFYVTKRFSSR